MPHTLAGLYMLCLLFLSACADQPGQPLPALRIQEPLPSLAAEYQTTLSDTYAKRPKNGSRHYRWRLYRAADRIETHNLCAESSEVWSRTHYGEINHQQLFHAQKRLIEYVSGDLKAIGQLPIWTTLATLISPTDLSALHAVGEERYGEFSAIRYAGSIAEEQETLELLWLPQLQLPALIKRQRRDHALQTRLIEWHHLGDSPWPTPETADYRVIDFADLGDKEHDPALIGLLPGSPHPHSD
ncbi:hypothetical protein [Methylomonas sp. HYX-M1]|uniref:hypothetical protein n=2 Tax=Methylomonas TaxID=416 RepID=UPI00345BA09F